jgi:hypothetical protein
LLVAGAAAQRVLGPGELAAEVGGVIEPTDQAGRQHAGVPVGGAAGLDHGGEQPVVAVVLDRQQLVRVISRLDDGPSTVIALAPGLAGAGSGITSRSEQEMTSEAARWSGPAGPRCISASHTVRPEPRASLRLRPAWREN